MTPRCSICRAPDPLGGLALLGESLQHILLSAEVHLVRRASAENGARYLFIVLTDVWRKRFRKPEVQYLRRAVGPDLDVRRLQVSMNDAFFMRRFEPVGDLDKQRDNLVDGNRALRDNLGERLALDQLHDEELLAVVLFETIERGYVRVIELR